MDRGFVARLTGHIAGRRSGRRCPLGGCRAIAVRPGSVLCAERSASTCASRTHKRQDSRQFQPHGSVEDLGARIFVGHDTTRHSSIGPIKASYSPLPPSLPPTCPKCLAPAPTMPEMPGTSSQLPPTCPKCLAPAPDFGIPNGLRRAKARAALMDDPSHSRLLPEARSTSSSFSRRERHGPPSSASCFRRRSSTTCGRPRNCTTRTRRCPRALHGRTRDTTRRAWRRRPSRRCGFRRA